MSRLINRIQHRKPSISLAGEANKPVFSFEYLQDTSIKGNLKDQGFLFDFLNHLREISRKSWTEILNAPRHSLIGIETLPLNCFVPRQFPAIVTSDVKKLMVFRAAGDNRIFAGVKAENTFYVIFVETKIHDIGMH